MNPDFIYLTNALFDEKALELEASSSILEDLSKSAGKGKSQRFPTLSRLCLLNIIIYGPIELFEDVGSFFQDYDLYLQDPVDCKQNVRYCNPHRLPLLDTSVTKFTSDVGKRLARVVEMEDVESLPELLDILDSQEDLPETPSPRSIETPLAK